MTDKEDLRAMLSKLLEKQDQEMENEIDKALAPLQRVVSERDAALREIEAMERERNDLFNKWGRQVDELWALLREARDFADLVSTWDEVDAKQRCRADALARRIESIIGVWARRDMNRKLEAEIKRLVDAGILLDTLAVEYQSSFDENTCTVVHTAKIVVRIPDGDVSNAGDNS